MCFLVNMDATTFSTSVRTQVQLTGRGRWGIKRLGASPDGASYDGRDRTCWSRTGDGCRLCATRPRSQLHKGVDS